MTEKLVVRFSSVIPLEPRYITALVFFHSSLCIFGSKKHRYMIPMRWLGSLGSIYNKMVQIVRLSSHFSLRCIDKGNPKPGTFLTLISVPGPNFGGNGSNGNILCQFLVFRVFFECPNLHTYL